MDKNPSLTIFPWNFSGQQTVKNGSAIKMGFIFNNRYMTYGEQVGYASLYLPAHIKSLEEGGNRSTPHLNI